MMLKGHSNTSGFYGPTLTPGTKNSPVPVLPEGLPKRFKKVKDSFEKKASDILEEAFHILRTNPWKLLALYYLGAFPFAASLLYFINNMSLGSPSFGEMEIASIVLALSFAWKNFTQSLFCMNIMNILNGKENDFGFAKCARIFIFQNIVQPLSLVIQSISILFILSIGWTTAFFNSFAVLAAVDEETLPEVFKNSIRMAWEKPKQNHCLLFLEFFLAVVVSLNIAIALLLLPYLAKTFLGIESMFSMSLDGMLTLKYIFNITYWSIVLTGTWLLVDPLLKAAYVTRVFYLESDSRGYDILARIAALAKASGKGACLLTLFSLFWWFPGLMGAEDENTNILPSDRLEITIKETLKSREYKWRMPPQHQEGKNNSIIFDAIKELTQRIDALFKKVFSFIQELFDGFSNSGGKKSFDFFSVKNPGMVVVAAFLLLSGSILVVVLICVRRKRKRMRSKVSVGNAQAAPDLADENTMARDMNKSAWLESAVRLFGEGNPRLAVRAVFFALLCLLSEDKLLTLTKFKTDREYFLELKRRAHSNSELVESFNACMAMYEKVWYGGHEAREIYADMMSNYVKIKGNSTS